jgi:hypothetical protein
MVMRFDSEFPLDEPPTMPHRTLSGDSLKTGVIRAMSDQQDAFKRCYAALDSLVIKATRKFTVQGIRT